MLNTLDYKIKGYDFQLDNGEMKESILVSFPISRFNVWIDPVTKQVESIAKLPVILHHEPKIYTPSTNVQEAKEAALNALKLYNEIYQTITVT